MIVTNLHLFGVQNYAVWTIIADIPQILATFAAAHFKTVYRPPSMLHTGDKAPSFTLRASDKSRVSLQDFRGQHVVLLFFPLAFTGVCTKELCALRDGLADYQQLNAQVLAISVDSLFTLHKWKQEQDFNFPMLSDFNKTVSKKYDVLYKEFVFEMKGVSKRSAFVIDKEGIIRYAEVLENAGEMPDFEAVKKNLASLN